ncbi:carbohydrate-binding module family 21 protein [Daedalea quercina L-15889]|uniref:Carbohydrate-binding module family 21 protein n=1 Tax=Daedalea quercina L-15889 TaxID=1314783 RepID=A0A165TGG2_9APHY|nr:carbohydrate-binding module family 21 protein [Daedalea quercina L-15889]
MPYAVPADHPAQVQGAPSTTATTTSMTATNGPASPRLAGHRRTRSSGNFSDERGPGAFVSLGALPRSHKRAVFHIDIHNDNDNDDDGDDDNAGRTPSAHPTRSYASPLSPTNSLRLSMHTGKFSPSVEPPSRIEIPSTARVDSLAPGSVPFPTSSPASPSDPNSPFIPTPTLARSQSSSASSLPRTPSTPIILSNGKPLKPSLKSSSSSPNIAGLPRTTKHLRAQSAPSTPAGPKNVHFAEKDSGLETVRVFSRSGKPASLSKPPGEETETETEAESSSMGPNSFPFPSLASNDSPLHEIDTNPSRTSAVPAPDPDPYANVHLETLTLPRTRPPALRGTVLVRNLHFEKRVAVRFTLDDWQTTSEVTCRHVVSLPSLPPPFPHEHRTVGDLAAGIASGQGKADEQKLTWDRFSFTIRLEDYEHKLADRTLYLVTRYSPGSGGEWWDNNRGQNYKISFRRAPAGHALNMSSMGFGSIGSGSFGTAIAQQRTFSAPTTLRSTPMTGAPQRAADAESIPRARARVHAPELARSSSNPLPSSPGFEEPTSAPAKMEQGKDSPTSPVQEFIARRLSLSNYVAPGTASMVTPPMTPPGSVRARSASLPVDAGMHADVPGSSAGEEDKQDGEGVDEANVDVEEHAALPAPSLSIIGGQPATTVSPAPAPPSASTSSKPSSLAPLDVRLGTSDVGVENNNNGTQLLSPPSSPAITMSPLALSLSGLNVGPSSGSNQSSGSSTPTNTAARPSGFSNPAPTSPLDSSYAALIRQWCFTGSPSGSPTHSANTTPSAAGFGVSGGGFGRGYGGGGGGGFPGFAVGGMADAGMVGAQLAVHPGTPL